MERRGVVPTCPPYPAAWLPSHGTHIGTATGTHTGTVVCPASVCYSEAWRLSTVQTALGLDTQGMGPHHAERGKAAVVMSFDPCDGQSLHPDQPLFVSLKRVCSVYTGFPLCLEDPQPPTPPENGNFCHSHRNPVNTQSTVHSRKCGDSCLLREPSSTGSRLTGGF